MGYTINKIIPYVISSSQIEYLRNAGIINGIGGHGHNIEIGLLNVIKGAYNFDDNKSQKLLGDIRTLSIYHDIDYFFKMGFYKSNLKFVYRLFRLIHFDSLIHRIGIFIFTFFILNKYGKKYY